MSLTMETEPLSDLIGARARWRSGRIVEIFDVSFTGVALGCYPGMEAKIGDDVKIHFVLAGQEEIEVRARVVRIAPKKVAVEFVYIAIDARKKLENFLKDKLIGTLTREVKPQFYPKEVDFTDWFHGPNDTNIFLWNPNNVLKKALIEIEGKLLFWDNGLLTEGKGWEYTTDYEDHYASEAVRRTEAATHSPSRSTLLEGLDLLTQIDDPKKSLKSLIAILIDTLSRCKVA